MVYILSVIRNYSVPKSEVSPTAQTFLNMFLILLIPLLRCVCSIKVIVVRTEEINDQITYEGLDSGICSKIGASVFLKSGDGVVCSCSAAKTYYSTSVTDNPSCRSDDGQDLGCPKCTGSCIKFISASGFFRYSPGSHYTCSSTYGTYTIKTWNGNSWVQFSRTNDFTVKFTRVGIQTGVVFQVKASASLWQYDGQLFLITPYCRSKPLPCFLAKAAGFQTYTTIGSGNTNEGGEDNKGDSGNDFKIPTRRRRVTVKKTSSKKKSKTAAPAGGAAAFIILIVIIIFIYYKRRSIRAAISTLRLKQENDNNENTNVPAAPKVNPAFVLGTSGMSQPPPYMPNNAEGLTMQLQHTALPASVVPPPPNSTHPPYPQSLVSQPPPMQPPVACCPTVPYPLVANNMHHAQQYPAVSTQSSGYVSAPSQASLQTQTNPRNRSKGNKILSSVVSGITSGFIDSLTNDEE